MTFLITFLISLAVSYAIGQALMDPQGNRRAAEPMQAPNVEEGRIFPVVFGTPKRISDPTIAWYGDMQVVEMYKKIDGGWFHSDKKVTTGFKYYLGMHMLLCHGPIDGVKQIYVGDTLIWPDPKDATKLGVDGTTSINLNLPNIFGGNNGEGGIVGTVDIQYGLPTQDRNAYLVSKLGANVSAFRGLVGVVLKKLYLGNSSYLKSWEFLVKRTSVTDSGLTQWLPAKADIDGDMNPAHILREIYTNQRWGLAYSTAELDPVTWEAAANTLYTEGFGLSILWEGNKSAEDLINEILQHINAVIYQDHESGLFKLKLVRDDYSVPALDTFSTESIISIEDFTRPSYGLIPDTIYINYWDPLTNKQATVPNHDIAILDIQGRSVSEELNFPYITKPDLASKVASRERANRASMGATMTIVANRRMSHLKPGDVFVLSWPALGITSMIVRVATINYGTLQDGRLRLTCTEDIWATQQSIYSTVLPSGWLSPINAPTDCETVLEMELPFYSLIEQWDMPTVLGFADDVGYLGLGAVKPTSDCFDLDILVSDDGVVDFTSEGTFSWIPTGQTSAGIAIGSSNITVTVANPYNLDDVAAGSYALIDNEILKVVSVDLSTYQVVFARAVLDTVPTTHSSGARIWFIGTVLNLVSRQYVDGDTPHFKILPRTGRGRLDEATATEHTATAMNSRQIRPYPPANLSVNASAYPATFTGQPTVSWLHRDRTQQLELIEQSHASIGPETGTTYSLNIYNENNVLVRSETGLTGTSYTYSEANERADCGLAAGDCLNYTLRFELWSVRDGYDSWQKHDITVQRLDTTPPSPNPMTWDTVPTMVDSSSITMTATTAADN